MRSVEFLRLVTVFAGVSAAILVASPASAGGGRFFGQRTVVVVNQAVPPAGPATPATKAPTAAPKPGFKGFADLEDAVTIATGVSPDKQAITVLFRNLEASVDPIKGGPLVDVRTLTVLLPLEKQDKDVLLTIDIRGFSELHNSKGTLMVQGSGLQPTIIPIADAQKDARTEAQKKADTKPAAGTAPDNAKQARELAEKQLKPGLRRDRDESNGGGDFHSRLSGQVKPGATAKITFVLLVERDFANTSAGGLINIDSLDVSISEVPQAPPPPPVESAPEPKA